MDAHAAARLHSHAASALALPLLAAAHLVWIPSAALVVVLFALAAAPAYVVASAALAQVPDTTWPFVRGLAYGVAIPLAYGVVCVLFPLLVALSRLLLGARSREGTIPLTSPRMFAWYHVLLSTYAVNTFAGPALRAFGAYKWFARAMGMRVGRGAVLNTYNLYDHDLIEIGPDAIVGGDAFVTGHVVEDGHLVRRRVRIGARAVIGLHAVVLPGATIGDGCHVGALSLVPKDEVLAAGGRYGGVPARPLRRV